MVANTTTNPYQMLARHLDQTPLGAPECPELYQLLQELFTPQEAELAAKLPFKPTALTRLAEMLGTQAEELEPKLERLTEKGLLYQRLFPNGKAYYSLLPVVPGILELQFMDGTVSEEKKKLAALFDAYYAPGVGKAMIQAPMPYSRVIPVGKALENHQQILPYHRAEQIIQKQEAIALATCYCRHEAELLDKACDNPKDVCLIFGAFAHFIAKQGKARLISQKEALGVLARAEEAGLVHVSDNVATGANFLCNCCGCCCLFLKTLTKLKRPGAVAPAAYLAQVDTDTCAGCGLCAERCQVDAVALNQDDLAQVDPARCLGCGLCATTCPTGSIQMQKRREPPKPAADWLELVDRLKGLRQQNQEQALQSAVKDLA